MTFKVLVSCDLPIKGIAEVEAPTPEEALIAAKAKYYKDQKNFNVEIYNEDVSEASEEVLSSSDVRSTERSDDPSGGDLSQDGSQVSEVNPQ